MTSFQQIHTTLLDQMHQVMKKAAGEEVRVFERAYFSKVCSIIGGFTYLCMNTNLNVTIRTDDNVCVVKMVKE